MSPISFGCKESRRERALSPSAATSLRYSWISACVTSSIRFVFPSCCSSWSSPTVKMECAASLRRLRGQYAAAREREGASRVESRTQQLVASGIVCQEAIEVSDRLSAGTGNSVSVRSSFSGVARERDSLEVFRVGLGSRFGVRPQRCTDTSQPGFLLA